MSVCRWTITTGLQRVGSTWVYNVTRLLCQMHGGIGFGLAQAEWVPKLLKIPTPGPIAVKVHWWRPAPDNLEAHDGVCFFPYRHPFDVVASHILLPEKTRSFEHIVGALSSGDQGELMTASCLAASSERVHMIRYEKWYDNPAGLVRFIAVRMGLSLADMHVDHVVEHTRRAHHLAIIEQLPPGGMDATTELRPEHISKHKGKPGTWRKVLNEEQRKHATDKLRTWLDLFDYKDN